jgi:hypothetical protein
MPPQPSKFVSAVIYLAAVIVIGSLLKSIRSFHQIDQLLIGLVFWGGLFFLLIKSRMKYLEKMLPFTIAAVHEGLLVREIFYPREDIAELSLFAPGARVSANSFRCRRRRRRRCSQRRNGAGRIKCWSVDGCQE